MVKTKERDESCQYEMVFSGDTQGAVLSVGIKMINMPGSGYLGNYFIAIRKSIGYNYQLLSKVRSSYFSTVHIAFPDVVHNLC
jgi:hypothetical protein